MPEDYQERWARRNSVKLPAKKIGQLTEHVEPQPKARTTPGQAGEVVSQYTADRTENDRDMSKE